MPANLKNSAVATGLEIPKKVKEYSNYQTTALISHASKVMLKILQARLQQYVNQELPDIQAGFRKGRGTRDEIANTHGITEKPREFQRKISTSASLQAAGAGGGQSLGVSGAFVASLLISPLKSWGWVWRLQLPPLYPTCQDAGV